MMNMPLKDPLKDARQTTTTKFRHGLIEVLCVRCLGEGSYLIGSGFGHWAECFACDGFGDKWRTYDGEEFKKGTLPLRITNQSQAVETVDPVYFWSHIKPADENGCRMWDGDKNNAGYGYLLWATTSRLAHRVAWRLTHGRPVPDGMTLDHYRMNKGEPCSKLCVEHVEPVTLKENLRRYHEWSNKRDGVSYSKVKVCKRGHEGSRNDRDKFGKCLECKKITDKKYRKSDRS